MKNVEFSYSISPKKNILKIVHWHVKQGEQLFIHGPSGSGKSTLLNLICGLQTANLGNIRVLGKSFDMMSTRQKDKYRAEHIGYIFQQFNLIEYLNAIDNIKLARHFSSSAHEADFLPKVHALLLTLNLTSQDWYRPVNQLSVGQQQRVSIARALINKPKLIIADEPTSSLDQASRDNFISLLTSLCKKYGSTLLFVSHDMSLCQHFDISIALAQINSAKVIN
ncbi:MAG: ABC transporter ATP-binding protein [Litorilituus sp.]|jgi:putative ABC transport system ATP-binding protein|nr:ABC transporter ATP-binding protein [Litorilituus sp.]